MRHEDRSGPPLQRPSSDLRLGEARAGPGGIGDAVPRTRAAFTPGGETPQELAHLPLGELDLQSTEYQGGTKND